MFSEDKGEDLNNNMKLHRTPIVIGKDRALEFTLSHPLLEFIEIVVTELDFS